MNEHLGNKILCKRKEKGLTQADIAAQFGISVQAVSKWERGLTKPSNEIFGKLVDLLGLDVETPMTEKKKPRLTRFISAFYYDVIRIICIGVMIAGTVCIPLGFVSTETAITSIGTATSVFCLTEILKRA